MSERPPRVIGGTYRVGELLGRGAMGEVFAATDPNGTQVALKLLHPAHSSLPDVVARFKQEATIAAKVRGEYVAAVLGAGMDHTGRLWIAFERLHGEPLDRTLSRLRRLAMHDVRWIVRDILLGLQAAHAQRVIHRDLKPANTFLESRSPPRARILDFGVSKLRASTSISTVSGALTEAGDSLGTLSFMAPEQIADSKGVDERADLYSVGVVAFLALTGTLPFEGASGDMVLQFKLNCDARRLADVRPRRTWRAALEAFFATILSRERAARYPTAEDALAAWLGATAA